MSNNNDVYTTNNFTLSKPIYKVTVRYKNGGWFSGDEFESEHLDTAKTVGLRNYTRCGAYKGGYFTVMKTQYIDGDKMLPVKELVEFIGNEEEFLLNNKMTVKEYKKDLEKDNAMSFRIAPEILKLSK